MNCGLSELREKVINFMESVPALSRLKGEKWYEVEDAIVALLEQELGVKDTTYNIQKEE